jgi:hypothetical protein
MPANSEYWEYLIVTVANEKQAAVSRQQLQLRRQLCLLEGIGDDDCRSGRAADGPTRRHTPWSTAGALSTPP